MDFYEAESDGLGDIFLGVIQQGLEHLGSHPRAGRRVLGEIRSYVVARFPYSIVYRTEKDQQRNRLLVLAVAHHRRRPRYWVERA